ncbi:uncharacterized protein LOC134288754 [Aedes albopictus]|uniref:Uncharacterized protein n=1 Tax=Aedes albopictus TaxID=7160 RepID=A0ABM1XNR2_AEDAL
MCRDKDGSILTGGREVIERWKQPRKQHCDEHLNGAENADREDEGRGRNDYVSTAGSNNELTPTLREVKEAIKQLKNIKSAGKDGIRAELMKMRPKKLATCLHRLIVWIWETEQLPEDWKEEGVICVIYKKDVRAMNNSIMMSIGFRLVVKSNQMSADFRSVVYRMSAAYRLLVSVR